MRKAWSSYMPRNRSSNPPTASNTFRRTSRSTTPASVLVSSVVDVADPLVLCRQIACNERASVGRPVVNEDQFPVRKRLVANALHRFFQKALLIEENQHDRDQRHGSSLADLLYR
jgi:hypothetical protein